MGTIDNYDQMIKSNIGKTFTGGQARAFQDILNRQPTGDINYRWVDLETGATIYYS